MNMIIFRKKTLMILNLKLFFIMSSMHLNTLNTLNQTHISINFHILKTQFKMRVDKVKPI